MSQKSKLQYFKKKWCYKITQHTAFQKSLHNVQQHFATMHLHWTTQDNITYKVSKYWTTFHKPQQHFTNWYCTLTLKSQNTWKTHFKKCNNNIWQHFKHTYTFHYKIPFQKYNTKQNQTETLSHYNVPS